MLQIQKDLEALASLLPDYNRKLRDKDKLNDWADKYCEFTDRLTANPDDQEAKTEQEKYLAAIMLKSWTQVNNLYQKTKTVSSLDYEDFITVLYERINYACKYRAWQDPAKHTNFQACLNQAIATEVKNIYYFANLDKYRMQFNTTSLDTPLDSSDDESDTIGTTIEYDDTESKQIRSSDNVRSFVQQFIDKDKIVEAIILDTIAFNDTIKTETSRKSYINEVGEKDYYKETITSFWSYRTMQYLNDLPKNYKKYFTTKYSINDKIFDAAFDALNKATNQKKYKYISKALELAKTNVGQLLN